MVSGLSLLHQAQAIHKSKSDEIGIGKPLEWGFPFFGKMIFLSVDFFFQFRIRKIRTKKSKEKNMSSMTELKRDFDEAASKGQQAIEDLFKSWGMVRITRPKAKRKNT